MVIWNAAAEAAFFERSWLWLCGLAHTHVGRRLERHGMGQEDQQGSILLRAVQAVRRWDGRVSLRALVRRAAREAQRDDLATVLRQRRPPELRRISLPAAERILSRRLGVWTRWSVPRMSQE